MRGINKVILVGNIGQDPESRTFPDGGQLTNISVATSESWKDKQTGQQQERTEWHRVTFNGRLAEIAAQYLKKGSKVYIEGQIRTRKWTDKQGVEKYTTEIVGRELQMLDSKGDNSGQQQGYQPQQQNQAPQQSYQQQQHQPTRADMNALGQHQQAPQQQPAPSGFDSFDESSDLLF